MLKLPFIFSLVLLSLAATVTAAEPETFAPLGESNAPLAMQGDVVLTQAEIDAAFSKIPPELRLTFIRDGNRVEALVRNLLTTKILAEEARKAGYDKDKLQAIRLQMAAESELAKDWITKVISEVPEVDYKAMAYENYLLNPDQWKTPDTIDVSHILISSEGRSTKAASEIAMDLWEQLQEDPSLFDSMVMEFSEDPSKSANNGRFPNVKREEMVKPFEEVAFALETPGQISTPVETDYGFHIIRLNEKTPGMVPSFESIEDQAVEQARKQYIDEYRKKYLSEVLNNPIVLPDGAAEEMAKRYFGEELQNAPDFED